MSFQFNSDRETIRAIAPTLVGTQELSIRSGSGSDEKEVLRTLLDPNTDLPRVGINRTGNRIDRIVVNLGGTGYTTQPTVNIAPPPAGGTQALGTAIIDEGFVTAVLVDNPGLGYTSAPAVTITGGNGTGAQVEAFLDTVDFELDINGAIRTSTSIISDTARILNLDIDNFITPDAKFRAPDLKTYANGTGIPWSANVIVQKDAYRFRGPNVYQALNAGETGSTPPLHKDGTELNGEVNFKHIGFRVNDVSGYKYQETGESGEFPRSITPLLGDRSTKIATTEYVLNLATNDVGGRIYVSSQIGNDLNDGRSAVAPVRTIKKAAQLAWATPGVKETLIVSGGDYVEDNPISLPPDASVVGDNLRLVIIRPANPRKHIFKFGDKNYVIGVTYRDQIDSSGDAVATWDYAMVFDDKQRINYDYTVNGDFGTKFPIGTQIFGPEKFRADFQTNTGLANLVANLPVRGVNTGAQGILERVEFTTTTGPSAYVGGNVDFSVTSGTFTAGETFQFGGQGSIKWQPDTVYTAGQILWATDYVYTVAVGGTSAASSPVHDTGTVASGPDTLELTYLRDAYEFVSTDIRSIRAEGEVVFEDTNITDALPIVRVDFSLQGDPSIATGGFQDPGSAEDLGGIVFYTNALVGRQNTHNFKEGQEILIEGMPTSSPDLSFLNGKQRIYKVLEDADGRARRFVIPKKTTITTTDNFDPGQFCSVRSYEKSITISLLNSPNRFPMATPIARRYQDACLQIRNNVDFIADEVVGKINDQFKKDHFAVYGIGGTPDAQFTPTNVTYNPATGDAVFTVNNHGLSLGDGVKIADESIVFTCAMDGNKTEHALPESYQYASGKSLPITAVTTNTFTLNVGASGPNQYFTPSAATYNPATGDLNLTIGTHTLSVGEGIVIDDNSLSFTCDMDNNQSVKTYPRPGIDPFAGRSMPITEISSNSITVNAGVSRANQYFTPSAATYDAGTGDLTVTVGQHGLGVGRSVVLENNSFTFTCDQNGHETEHTYPRDGIDPYAGKSIEITAVGSTQHTVTNAVYTASNGQVDITIANHGFQEGDYIKFDDLSLTFTCSLDGNTVQKSYPRAGYDYPSGRWLPITNISTNGFRVNIGPSDYTGAHTFVSASANGLKHQDGTFTINVGDAGSASGSTHLFVSASSNAIKHEPQSTHTFTGSLNNAIKHLPQSAHTFVRSNSNSLSVGGSDLKIYLGTSRFVHDYVSGGTIVFGGSTYNITNFVYDNVVTGEATITLNAPVANLSEDAIIRVADIVLECTVDGVVTQKTYPSFNIPTSDDKCRRDIGHFISAITRDLEFGSNYNVIEAAKKYIDGTNTEIDFVNNEIIQTVRALEYTRELMIFAMRKWRMGTGTPGESTYTPQYSSLPQYFDPTIIDDTASPACANVASAIDTLAYLFIDVLANNASGTYLDGAYLIARNRDLIADEAYRLTKVQYPNLAHDNIDERKCFRDINHIISAVIRDLVLGGNYGIVNAAESYFTGAALTGIPENELAPARFAFEKARDLSIAAMRNWTDGNVLQVTPSTATYDSTTGVVVVTIPTPGTLPQGLSQGSNDRIAFAEGAITFSCSGGQHASPDKFDSNFGQSYAIIDVVVTGATTTISCNVGDAGSAAGVAHTFVSAIANGTKIIFGPVTTASPIPKFEDWSILTDSSAAPPAGIFTPTDATYDPATGDFVMTVNGHGLTTSNSIRLQPESFVFTCAMDGNKTEHALPQAGQSAYGNNLLVTGTTTNTITVNVGASGPNQSFTPSNATYDPATGALELTIGTHTLDVGEGIVIADNSLSFTCDMDNRDSTKTYPRPGIDPYAGRSMKITSKTTTTITVDAGVSRPNQYFQPSAVNYNSTTGDMVVTVGQHGLGVGRHVVLADNSFTFTCDQDGNTTPKTYPRPGVDPQAGKSIAITDVGFSVHTVTDADYTASTGNVKLTIANHGFANGDYIKVLNGTLLFTCELDGNVSQKQYPRAEYDYPSGRWLQISNVSTNTFDINIGPSSYTGAHTFTGAISNGVHRQDGTFTINVGNAGTAAGSVHTFVSATAQAIKHEPQSTHYFEGASTNAVQHLPQSTHTFVRTSADSVTAYTSSTPALSCANVESSITTEYTLLDNILLYAIDTTNGIAPGATTRETGTLFDTSTLITYPESTIYDQSGLKITPRSDYADNPIIEASPYTQNSSVISFLGGGGAEVDGAKVKQPNCPFPGLELDGSASFPNQGKSMVASAFTIVSFGGTGYKVINDGYTQLVSVFVIFCADGVLAESGGYCSITNSATNFGIFALRGSGFREEAYSFDVGQITNVSSTPTGRTIFTVNGLGREPLEHYVVKVDGFSNVNPDIEYFVDVVEGVTVGPPFSAQLTIESGSGGGAEFKQDSTGNAVSVGTMVGETLRLHRPSIVNSSSHTWEFAGSGTNYNALPENGGTKVEAYEQVSENYGRVYVSGTDELGDFKVGTFARIENRTGAITFTGTVTISEVEFLKLKGGDVVVTGFDASNTLGGANSTDSKLPTQKAVKDYITNNLGPYLNKPYSTNPVPRALVELTDSGKISEDQIPPLRPFQVYTVANQAERVAIEGALAGDIAIQQDTNTSFILNNDNDSLFVAFPVDSTLQFTIGDVFTGSNTGGKIQATEYREGVVYQINITDGGSGYVTPPVVTISGGNPQAGAVSANATCEIANGIVVLVTIELFNGLIGGKGYTTAPVVTFAAPAGSGTQAQGNALIESRLYGDIVNNIKMEDTDEFESSDVPSETINISRVVNTSASNSNNWVSLSSNQIAANDITSGVIATARLAFNNAAANSFSFLRGDQSYAPVIQSLKGAETRYFAKLTSQANSGSSQLIFATNSDVLLGHEVVANINGIQPNTNITGILTAAGTTTVSIDNPLTATIPINSVIEFERGQSPLTFESSLTQGDFIDSVVIASGGSGFTDGQYFDVELTGGAGTGLKANIIVTAGTVTELTLTAAGTGYLNDFTVSTAPAEIGSGSGLVLLAKLSTVNKQFANVAIDIARASDLTISADEYGTIGVSRFYKDQFDIGLAGNGSIKLKTGADSGLDADKLDGAQGSYYLNSTHQNAGTLPVDRLSGTYNISIANQSGSTLKLNSSTSNLNSNPTPDAYNVGIIADTRNNSADGLNDGGNQHVTLTIRNGGSGFDAGLGGVRQLAFTDNDNMYIRGSGSTLATFGTWAKVWHSDASRGGMGELSGLDADRLDFREGAFYQNAINMNTGIFSDERLPSHQTAKDFQDSVRILDWEGKARYKILVRDELLTATPFLVGQQVNLYAANGTAPGRIAITEVAVNQDINDAYNNYTLITGTLVTGNFIGAIEIGTTAQSYPFQDFSIATLDANADGLVDGTFEVATLESDGGAARLKLGRNDQISATDPSIFFRSSLFPATNYNSAIIATGGTSTDGSGALEFKTANVNAMTLLGNILWNEGNLVPYVSNVGSTYGPNNNAWDAANPDDNATLRSIVMRDKDGNFNAGTITANLTGAASLNVLKAGDTMSGTLIISGIAEANQALSVSGRGDFLSNITVAKDLTVNSNTLHVDATDDTVSIGTTSSDSDVKLLIVEDANQDVVLRMYSSYNVGGAANQRDAKLQLLGQSGTLDEGLEIQYDNSVGDVYFKQLFNSITDTVAIHFSTGAFTDALTITGNGNLGIQRTADDAFELDVNGSARIKESITIGFQDPLTNNGAPLIFAGATGASDGSGGFLSNFRVGNQLLQADTFEITASDSGGPTNWKSVPAIAIKGSDNRVAINTLQFGGTDTTVSPQEVREYALNIQGDININGLVFQDNAEFVTSRWTESDNELDIYRESKVWVNPDALEAGFTGNPDYDLQVGGGNNAGHLGLHGIMYVRDTPQWIDTTGIIKNSADTIAEDVTIPANANAMSIGPITIQPGVTIDVVGNWNII